MPRVSTPLGRSPAPTPPIAPPRSEKARRAGVGPEHPQVHLKNTQNTFKYTGRSKIVALAESLARVIRARKSVHGLANPPTGHGGFATPETFQLKEVLDDRRICQVGISDLANPQGPENMGERFDQDQLLEVPMA